MKKSILVLFSVLFLLCSGSAVFAWTDHTQLTYLIFAGDPAAKTKVTAESLDSFLSKEKNGLPASLRDEESWLKKNLAFYPPLPDKLVFTGKNSGSALRSSFVRAIRVNPTMPFPLFLQVAPGAPHTREKIADSKVSILDVQQPNAPFEKLKPGEKVSALDVLATAADEPDFGMDIELFESSKSSFGKEYGFGEQPWGNPIYAYGSQAPFHMGFFHENRIIALAAPFTQKSLSEYRFHEFSALSVYAFKTGHPYWGYRFAGWALHYLQDSAVAYHERMLPGISTFSVLKISVTGDQKTKDAYLNSVSNKHYIYEDYAYYAVKDLLEKKDRANPLLAALADSAHDAKVPAFTPLYIKEITSAKAESSSNRLDELLTSVFPAKFTSDPSYVYGTTEKPIDLFAFLSSTNKTGASQINESYTTVFRDLGSYSRGFISWIKKGNITEAESDSQSSLPIILVIAVLLIAAAVFIIRTRKPRRTQSENVMPVKKERKVHKKPAAHKKVKSRAKRK